MMKLLITSLLLALASLVQAQQWMDKKYAYDSTLNVVYGTATNFNGQLDTLKMDIYTPICDDTTHLSRRPLLMWIHGGAFLAGSKDEVGITQLCKQFAQRGYVTASINYRLGFVSDNSAWNCNYPNYSCVFASDTAEWIRALYRGIQDGKGAVRYLVNRHQTLRIDTSNIFVAGESAGAFVAMGVALLDTTLERMPHTFALPDAPKPASNTQNCIYNQGETFGNTVARPDLGDIHGNIEPSTVQYTIKAVGNMYGAMVNDLLKYHPANQPKPAIYSFHQPCDLVVPIDSGRVYQGLSWCFTNGYNCYGITHTPKVYGSRTISQWNTANNYGYTIQNEFTATNFPFNFFLGSGSCLDQVNVPCHAYDNFGLRENNLANFFAPRITTTPICDTTTVSVHTQTNGLENEIRVFPNPVTSQVTIQCQHRAAWSVALLDLYGRPLFSKNSSYADQFSMDMDAYPQGVYLLEFKTAKGERWVKILMKI